LGVLAFANSTSTAPRNWFEKGDEMTKTEIKIVVDELRAGKAYDVLNNPLEGVGLPNWHGGEKRFVSKEAIVNFLRWQTMCLNGAIDYDELERCVYLLKKKVLMI
jgi:hypothetical protein